MARGSAARQARIKDIRSRAMQAAADQERRSPVSWEARRAEPSTRRRLQMNKEARNLPAVRRNAAVQRIGTGDRLSDFMSRGNGNRARRRAGR